MTAPATMMPVLGPATNEPIAEVPESTPADVDRAVAAARRAFEDGPWARMSARDRGRLLIRVAALLEARAEDFARLESSNVGKPIRESRLIDVPLAVDAFEYYAGTATKVLGETLPVPGERLAFTVREPVGVVGAITPFNFPLLMAAWKLAPALACGNTVVLKPAPETPLTTLELAGLCAEAGLPDGVVTVLPGGTPAGAALVEHPAVDKVAFTGSTDVGRGIAASAGQRLKRVSLELGGKAPNIVFDDAELDRAVAGALFGIFWNAGEICTAGSRILVHRPVYDAFLDRFTERAASLRVGHPLDEATQIGPLVSTRQHQRVLGYLEGARARNLQIRTGGSAPDDAELVRGNYVRPTVIAGVPDDDPVACEEIFGPVAVVLPFDTEDEAVRRANATPFGLTAGVWSRDVARALRVSRRLRAGTVWVNTYNVVTSEAPFGGFKDSGIGREMGPHAIELYTEVKTVFIDHDDRPRDWFGGRP